MSGPERTGAPEDAARAARAPEGPQASGGLQALDSTLAVAPGARFAQAARAAGIGVALPRLDRRARAGAALALQRSAGNAAVGRMVQRGRVLSRAPSIYAGPLQNVFTYPADDFDGRYEGVVDAGAGIITLRMRVKWEIEPQFANKTTGEFDPDTIAAYARMRARFKEVVRAHLVRCPPAQAERPLRRSARGLRRQDPDRRGRGSPHAVLHLFPQTVGGRSCASRGQHRHARRGRPAGG